MREMIWKNGCFLLLIILTMSCGEDPAAEETKSEFAQYEKQWVSTPSDYFGVDKGTGTYFFFFEDGVVSHYVDNGKLKGIIYTWDYSISEVDGITFIDFLESNCWKSNKAGFFEMHPGQDGFKLINVNNRSSHEFTLTTPTFDPVFETNACAVIDSDWIINYSDDVMANTMNDEFNRLVFKEGTAYTKTNRSAGFKKAFSYKSSAENDLEYLDILDVCQDYQTDFGIIKGLYDVKEYNNYDGEGNNGFVLILGTKKFVYLEDLFEFPGQLDTDCYSSGL